MTDPHPIASAPSDLPPFRYDARLASELETRWQARWEADKTYRVPNPGEPGFDASKPKFYCLDMFPYPSGAGLHVGHPEGYTATDIICRYMRMQGHNVLHPMGWDAFGLPAEQYAIQTGVHPAITTKQSIATFLRQLKRFGFSYDWDRVISTIDPEYYRWTQWIFLRLYDSWFDPQADSPKYPDGKPRRGAARPIADLIAQLESGDLRIGLSGELVHVGVASSNPLPGAEPVGTRRWHELNESERRAVIDDQRLAFIEEMTVNWCPALGTVLANDEVVDGKSERGAHPVLRKPLRQWQLRITAYAQRLLDDLALLEWPESTKTQQAEWIGKSEGAEIEFDIVGSSDTLTVFTTRPDTIFGATYMVIAPEHPLVDALLAQSPDAPRISDAERSALRAYATQARNRSDVDRMAGADKDKTGVFTGVFCTNPATGKEIPVWTADYVLMGYGTGAIMAVPAHDERDFAFAQKFNLPIVQVVEPPAGTKVSGDCFAGDGTAINSTGPELSINGQPTAQAKQSVIAWLEKTGRGSRQVNFRLRDWTFSRQRYWGEPIPIVFDEHGRHYPLADSALPLTLPELDDYAPVESQDPQPLLAKARSWVRTTAAQAGVDPSVLPPSTPVTRETNTMPGSAGSSWYFLRYCDPRNATRFISREADGYWMGRSGAQTPATVAGPIAGVDLYIGGSEHAVGHLLYSRFWQKFLFDLGEVSTPEPFAKLFHQGMITSFAYQRPDKTIVPMSGVREEPDGSFVEAATGTTLTPIVTKMSKRYGNVINPDDIIAQFGADTFRLYEMYMGPLDASKPWNTKDTVGCFRFLQRAWRACVDEQTGHLRVAAAPSPEVDKALHRAIAKIESDVPRLAFNTAIAALMELVNAATSAAGAPGSTGAFTRDQLDLFARALAPFTPHIAEELWHKLGKSGSVTTQPFPKPDHSKLVDASIELPVSVAGKVKHKLMVPRTADKAEIERLALSDPKVQELIAGKTLQRLVVVPGKMINLVLG